MKKILTINADNFFTLEGFYEEVERVLRKDVDWKLGYSLDALNDVLYGGYGVFEANEEIKIIWNNSLKSKDDLGLDETIKWYARKITRETGNQQFFIDKLKSIIKTGGPTLFNTIIEIILDHKNIELVLSESGDN